MEGVYSKNAILQFYNCDFKKRMSLAAILKETAQIAGEDYIDKGLNHKFLWENGYVFLLSKVSFEICNYPHEGDLLEISTWETGHSGPLFFRKFLIKGQNNEVFVQGGSGWVLVNPQTRKILRPNKFPWPVPICLNSNETDFIPNFSKIAALEQNMTNMPHVYTVGVTDLDANGHVYNARYADIAANIFSAGEYARDLTGFRINFSGEAKCGENIILQHECDPEKKVDVMNGFIDSNNCFECEFIWK